MGEAGILDPDVRYELLDGVITMMSPAGPRQAGTVNRIAAVFFDRLSGRVTVAVQNPMRLGHRSEPQPDVVIARYRRDFYASCHPTADDTYHKLCTFRGNEEFAPLAFPNIKLAALDLLGED